MNKDVRDAAEARIEALQKKHGEKFGPEVVVSDAANKKSVLHEYFEWDDAKAGHQYRMDQARTLIRSIRIRVVTETVDVKIPKYIRNPDSPENVQGYVKVADLSSDKDRSARALRYEIERLQACIDRVQRIASGLGFADEADILAMALERLREKVDG